MTLRERLIEVLSRSGYATRPGVDVAAMSRQLGITEELLLDAIKIARRREELRKREGKAGARFHVKEQRQRVGEIGFHVPLEVREMFLELSEKMKISAHDYLCNLLHYYAAGTYEPIPRTNTKWYVRGKMYPQESRSNTTRMRVHPPRALLEHLTVRTAMRGLKPTHLCRMLMTEAIEGRFCRPGTFKIISRFDQKYPLPGEDYDPYSTAVQLPDQL